MRHADAARRALPSHVLERHCHSSCTLRTHMPNFWTFFTLKTVVGKQRAKDAATSSTTDVADLSSLTGLDIRLQAQPDLSSSSGVTSLTKSKSKRRRAIVTLVAGSSIVHYVRAACALGTSLDMVGSTLPRIALSDRKLSIETKRNLTLAGMLQILILIFDFWF